MLKFHRIVATLALACFASGSYADEAAIRKSLAERSPEVQVTSVTKASFGGLYQVVVNGYNIFYTDETGEIGFFGNIVNFKTRENISQQDKDRVNVVDFSKLPLDKAIVRVKGTGARKMAIFTDPECPFCQELEKQLEQVNDVTIYTFLLPLTQLHPGSMRKAQLIWCAKDKAKAWDDMLLRQEEPKGSNTNCKTPIKEIGELAAKNWLTGTPAIIFANNKLLFGNQPVELINKQLDTPASQP